MVKIALIGAGGVIFSVNLIRDILLSQSLRDAHIVLMDIHEGRLNNTNEVVKKLAQQLGCQPKITTTQDLSKAVDGAHFVFTIFRVGTLEDQQAEYDIPKRFGVDCVVGDTLGPAGVFRGMRVLVPLVQVLEAMEFRCPGAYLFNYVNPMSINTIVLSRLARTVKVAGFCHSVPHTARELAAYLGVANEQVTYRVAGVNHQAFFLDFKVDGQDASSMLRKAMTQPSIYVKDKIRFEMFRHLGYFVTESSGHNSEYNPFFRKRPDLRERFCTLDPSITAGEVPYERMFAGESGASLHLLPLMQQENQRKIDRLLSGQEKVDIQKSDEYGIQVVEAITAGKPFRANLNVMNHGYIPNLPTGSCVDIPCFIDESGIHPTRIPDYPEHLAALNRGMVNVQMLAADGFIEGNRQKIFHAIAFDPLTSSICSLDEIAEMTDELFAVSKGKIPNRFYE